MNDQSLHPKFKRCLEFDDVRIGTVYDGPISEVEQMIKDEFSPLCLECNFTGWDDFYKKIEDVQNKHGKNFFWLRHPEYLFQENSLNVIYDCHFGPKPADNPTRYELDKAGELGEFISYFEGGSGRISKENADHYLAKNIRIFHLFKSREEYARHIKGYHSGREFMVTLDSLFGDNQKTES